MSSKIKKRKFASQTLRILDLVVNSLYSNKDVFIRELVSNAADAIDRARFMSLTNREILVDEWKILIEVDKKQHIIKIEDNGIGMNESEVIDNIGTIACSGTKAFLDSINNNEGDSVNLIGQFGVGFYSAFMVSDKVLLETKKAGTNDVAVKWSSDGRGEYHVEESNKLSQGTVITLYLKDEYENYLNEWKIKDIIKNYSDFVEYPIKLKKNNTSDENKDKEIDEQNYEYEIINSMKAIWLKDANEITEDEYNNFFNYISHSDSNPIKYIHYSVEGVVTFKALLYIPSKNMYTKFFVDNSKSLSLYVNKMFITNNCNEILPKYLRFICGVIDSSDLSLNISRETLQDNTVIKKIRNNITKKIITTLQKIKEENFDDYIKFFKEFGIFIKEGVYSDYENKNTLTDLLLFKSVNNCDDVNLSLKKYKDEMSDEQQEIYYIAGEDSTVLINSPHLEVFKKNNYNVLLMTDPIDELIVLQIGEYNGKKFRSVEKGDFDFKKREEEVDQIQDDKELREDFNSFFEFIRDILKDDIKLVRFSGRLLDSPCCLVNDINDYSSSMKKIMTMMNHEAPKSMKILELNQNNSIVIAIKKLFDTGCCRDDLNNYIQLLYNYALMINGEQPKNTVDFINNILNITKSDLDSKVNSIKDKVNN